MTRGGCDIALQTVTEGSPENEKFFKYDPAGQIALYAVNAEAAGIFEENKAYYFDITPAD